MGIREPCVRHGQGSPLGCCSVGFRQPGATLHARKPNSRGLSTLQAVLPDGGYRGGEKGGAGCGPASILWPARPLGRMRGPPAITRGARHEVRLPGECPQRPPPSLGPLRASALTAALSGFFFFPPPRSSPACWAPSTAAATSASPAMAAASSAPWGTGSPSST